MSETNNDRCTVYTKLTNYEHKQLLEMVSHSGRPVTQIIRDAVTREVDKYHDDHQIPLDPLSIIDKMQSQVKDKRRAVRQLKEIDKSGLFDKSVISALSEQAGLPVNNEEEPEPPARSMCRVFLQGLLIGRSMKTTDILGFGERMGFSTRQIQKSLSDVGDSFKEDGVYHWKLA